MPNRPYPSQYVMPWTLKDGTTVTIRPIREQDEPLLVEFHRSLSDESVYLRYFHVESFDYRTMHQQLARLCSIDYDEEFVFVAEKRDSRNDLFEIIGVARLVKLVGGDTAEFAVVISDAWQNHGLGTEMVRRLLQLARNEGLRHMTADILARNSNMRRVCQQLGFRLIERFGDAVIRVEADVPIK